MLEACKEMLIKGQRVIIKVDDPNSKLYKYNGEMGFVYEIACHWNPIPVVKLDSGKKIAIEKKHLKRLEQQNLFTHG